MQIVGETKKSTITIHKGRKEEGGQVDLASHETHESHRIKHFLFFFLFFFQMVVFCYLNGVFFGGWGVGGMGWLL